MDAAQEEIIQLVCLEEPRVDADVPEHSPTQAVSVTKVLDDDNLLREIIIRVGSPTTLVRAAVVCKRWLEHASDRKFLSRFCELHPPNLLGYYKYTKRTTSFQKIDPTQFVPMLPQPPEFAAIISCLERYNLGARQITHCLDNSIFTGIHKGRNYTREVHRPLCPKGHTEIIPPFPHVYEWNMIFHRVILKEEGSNTSYMYGLGQANEEAGEPTINVYMLQDGEWHMHTSATCPRGLHEDPIVVHFGHNKIYLSFAISDDIFVLDLMASSFSTIQLPQGVKYGKLTSMLSWADDASSVYLFNVKWFQLCIWLHKGGNWLLVDTICLLEMLSTLGISGHMLENEGFLPSVQIRQVRDNGQLVFLWMGQCIFYLDIKCRTLCKVYESTTNGRCVPYIHPLMMIWPPTFPSIKDDLAREHLDGQ